MSWARPAGVSERSLDALPFFLIRQDRVFLCSSRQVTLSQPPAHPLDRRALGSFRGESGGNLAGWTGARDADRHSGSEPPGAGLSAAVLPTLQPGKP